MNKCRSIRFQVSAVTQDSFALEELFKLTVLFASISLLPFYYDQMIQMIRSGEIKGTPTEEPSANVGHVMMECS